VVNIQWIGTPEDRILSIRKFRKYISELSFEEAVTATINQWEFCPILRKDKFDISVLEQWPTPWELFSENTFCKNSQCLGVLYTLIMSSHGKDTNFSVGIVNDVIEGIIPALLIGDKYLSEIEQEKVQLVQTITKQEILTKIKE